MGYKRRTKSVLIAEALAHDFKWEQIHDVGDFKQWRVKE